MEHDGGGAVADLQMLRCAGVDPWRQLTEWPNFVRLRCRRSDHGSDYWEQLMERLLKGVNGEIIGCDYFLEKGHAWAGMYWGRVATKTIWRTVFRGLNI
jgi:hypothetical protein